MDSLGSGGFGDTYIAEDRDLPGKPHCVVKHLKPKTNAPQVMPIAKKLFDREAETLYKLGAQSDRIPTLFAHFQENSEFYLVQEFVEGQDISQELTASKRLSESYVAALLQGILEVLAVAHRHNVIHRDIKPQNLMRRYQDGKIVLIDFGAVKEIGTLMVNASGETTVTIAVGTPGYMPDEQANGKPKLSSDIYAVGAMGIQALTGAMPHQLPKDPRTGELIWRDRVSVSDRLGDILEKMVRDHFSQRYLDATEALQALAPQNVSMSAPATVPVPSPTPAPMPETTVLSRRPTETRRQVLQWLALAGMGFAGAVLGREIWKSNPSPVPSPSTTNTPSPTPSDTGSSGQTARSPSSTANTPSPTPSDTGSSGQTVQTLSPSVPKTTTSWFTSAKVNSLGRIIESPQGQAQVMTENLGNGVTLEMVSIPGGWFVMGSPRTEARREGSEGPQRSVSIPAFFLGKYPVTQAQYQAVMRNNPAHFRGAKRPVENVSWNDATEFCRQLSRRTGKNYRLPSEAEWEYACRAGTTTPFSFGDTLTTDIANYDGDQTYGSGPKGKDRWETTNVGSFPANAFGLYDMHGNVFEWCQDVWHDNYEGAPTDGSAWESWGDSRNRLQRGGCWYNSPWFCRSAYRYQLEVASRDYYGGFRVVLELGV